MKQPLSIIIITKDRETMKDIYTRFETTTSYPRLKLLSILVQACFNFGKLTGTEKA